MKKAECISRRNARDRHFLCATVLHVRCYIVDSTAKGHLFLSSADPLFPKECMLSNYRIILAQQQLFLKLGIFPGGVEVPRTSHADKFHDYCMWFLNHEVYSTVQYVSLLSSESALTLIHNKDKV
jgi:hypothetical protein